MQYEFSVDTNYERVIPRDLFNEAKLLKCMGRLSLSILDNTTPCEMKIKLYDNGPAGFEIGLTDDGFLTVTNVVIYVKEKSYLFRTTYNSKDQYPLFLHHENVDYRVFDQEGIWDQEFLEFINTVK